ncbi:hypothetical protein PR002_g29869 [Phytophthora rubi]|uniref:Uncharacterized protein n=1 Tax=Phytophthora rubi TaxID=129364 RepID=A0A6A3GX15_9STRA|nr:hypothetical protein PR002_g29869 [Phytophthora rubi]
MAVATLEEEDDDLLHSAQGRAAVTEDQLLFSELDEVSDMLQLDLAAPTPIDPPVGVAQLIRLHRTQLYHKRFAK